MIVASRNGYVVDDDPARLDLDVLHGFLRTSYWSPGVPREVVERAVANNVVVFGLLFERHAKAIYNYCFRQTGSWASAEDLVSVVFLEAWRRRRDVSLHQDSALPWLYGVATNGCRNSLRSTRRHRAALRRISEQLAEPDP